MPSKVIPHLRIRSAVFAKVLAHWFRFANCCSRLSSDGHLEGAFRLCGFLLLHAPTWHFLLELGIPSTEGCGSHRSLEVDRSVVRVGASSILGLQRFQSKDGV